MLIRLFINAETDHDPESAAHVEYFFDGILAAHVGFYELAVKQNWRRLLPQENH